MSQDTGALRYFAPDLPYEVGREDVRAFARSVQAPPPQTAGDSIPPTFIAKIGTQVVTWLTTVLLADHPVGAFLHTEQAFTYSRPIAIGDRLSTYVTVHPSRAKAGGEIITFDADVRNQRGEFVQSSHTSLFSRVSEDTATIAAAALATLGPRLSQPNQTWSAAQLSTGDGLAAGRTSPLDRVPASYPLTVGTELPAWSTTLTFGDVVNYAGTSGDLNPIHWNPEIARLVGLESPLAHGMLTMGMGASYLTSILGSADCLLDYRVRFTGAAPIHLDADTQLTFTARVKQTDTGTSGNTGIPGNTATIALVVLCAGRRIFGRATATVVTG